jgi:streptogramin lyase
LWGLGYGNIGDGFRGTIIFKISPDDGEVIDRFVAPGSHTHYALTYHDGDLWLHGIGRTGAGRIYRLNRDDGETIKKYVGAEAATEVTGLCSDPAGQLWLLSAGGQNSTGRRWLRPLEWTGLKEVDAR